MDFYYDYNFSDDSHMNLHFLYWEVGDTGFKYEQALCYHMGTVYSRYTVSVEG